jgi:hypothetical protein
MITTDFPSTGAVCVSFFQFFTNIFFLKNEHSVFLNVSGTKRISKLPVVVSVLLMQIQEWNKLAGKWLVQITELDPDQGLFFEIGSCPKPERVRSTEAEVLDNCGS